MASAVASLNSFAMSAASSAMDVSSGTMIAVCVAAIADKAAGWSISRHSHLVEFMLYPRWDNQGIRSIQVARKFFDSGASVIHSIQPQVSTKYIRRDLCDPGNARDSPRVQCRAAP